MPTAGYLGDELALGPRGGYFHLDHPYFSRVKSIRVPVRWMTYPRLPRVKVPQSHQIKSYSLNDDEMDPSVSNLNFGRMYTFLTMGVANGYP